MRLYDFLPSGNGYKIRLLLSQLGIPFTLVEKDIQKGETRTPEFLAMNPNGRIPLLELDDGGGCRTRSSSTRPRGRRSFPATVRARRSRSGCSSSSTARP
jgi:hypothetical protein